MTKFGCGQKPIAAPALPGTRLSHSRHRLSILLHKIVRGQSNSPIYTAPRNYSFFHGGLDSAHRSCTTALGTNFSPEFSLPKFGRRHLLATPLGALKYPEDTIDLKRVPVAASLTKLIAGFARYRRRKLHYQPQP